jgi:hypothetical protein
MSHDWLLSTIIACRGEGGTSQFSVPLLFKGVRAVGLLTAIALFASLSFAAFDDLIAVTVGTRHGHEYHGHLLSVMGSVWHTSR